MQLSRALRLSSTASRRLDSTNPLQPALKALLPPIPLYRRLLRAHRKYLPHDMRVLGDEYIKREFRAHQKVDNPAQVITFLTEWQLYAQKVEGNAWKGDRVDERVIKKLNDDQLVQLHELMQAIKTPEEGGKSD